MVAGGLSPPCHLCGDEEVTAVSVRLPHATFHDHHRACAARCDCHRRVLRRLVPRDRHRRERIRAAARTATVNGDQAFIDYSHCMRDHGVADYPDPTAAAGHDGLSLHYDGDQSNSVFQEANALPAPDPGGDRPEAAERPRSAHTREAASAHRVPALHARASDPTARSRPERRTHLVRHRARRARHGHRPTRSSVPSGGQRAAGRISRPTFPTTARVRRDPPTQSSAWSSRSA